MSGGIANTASGQGASVSGGYANQSTSFESSVSGGEHNVASQEGTSVSGGYGNQATYVFSSVSGGQSLAANQNYQFAMPQDSSLADATNKLQDVSVSRNEMVVTGANLRIVNGLSCTATKNGTGNRIIGYNETRGPGDDRSGSHYLVLGEQNNYTSWGGIIAGRSCAAEAPLSSVLGGQSNDAGPDSDRAVIVGGELNVTGGIFTAVTGGKSNTG